DSWNCSRLRSYACTFRVGLWLPLLRLFGGSVLGFDKTRPCPLPRSHSLDRPDAPGDGATIFLVSCRATLRRALSGSRWRRGNRRVRAGGTCFSPSRRLYEARGCTSPDARKRVSPPRAFGANPFGSPQEPFRGAHAPSRAT